MQIEEPLARAPRGRLPRALVVRDLDPNETATPIDWSAWYLTDEEDMGESVEQSSILWQLLSALGQLAAERGWKNVFWSGDNFFAWVEGEPLVRVSPDAYLLDNPPPPPRPKSWQTWLPGHRPPRWAVEVVSDDWKKDYEDNPPKYAQLGTNELVIFDPEASPADASRVRVPLQVYRRGADGAFVRAYRGDGPAWNEELQAYLVVANEEGVPRLRIARDALGADRVPTAEERAREEATARRAAEERVRSLEAELAKLRGG
jgi:Uma2 family endonuclease